MKVAFNTYIKIIYLCFFLQLRYLQTLNSISAEKNSTIIFPLPIDLVKHLVDPTPGDPEPPRPAKPLPTDEP